MSTEDALLSFLENLAFIDFGFILQVIFGMFAALWGFTVLWVWSDSGERTTSVFFRLIVTLFVLPFNIPGLIIYYLIRPPLTIEEVYWSELERKYLVYETADLNDCPRCEEALMPGFNNCPNCGYVVKIKCPGCSVMVDRNHKYCQFCGEQNRQRAATKEVLTTEVMENAIEEQRADVIEIVENKGVRYTRSYGLVERIGDAGLRIARDFKVFFKSFKDKMKDASKKINDVKTTDKKTKISKKVSKTQEKKTIKIEQSEKKVSKDPKSKEKKAKAKKRRKKRSKK
jgi:hypothetical protein